MTFYDSLKGLLTQAGRSAAGIANGNSEADRLNAEINQIEDQIIELYAQIGYEIYVAYREAPIPEVEPLIEEVTALHVKIEDVRQEIRAVHSRDLCPNCGAPIKPGMGFCTGCGRPYLCAACCFSCLPWGAA